MKDRIIALIVTHSFHLDLKQPIVHICEMWHSIIVHKSVVGFNHAETPS